MTDCDVLVIGGGPAGAACAWGLRDSGLSVIVWDRRQFPRGKICAGWITPQVLDALALTPAAYAATGSTLQPIRGFRVSRMGDHEARVHYGRTVSYAIRRCEFDDHVLRRSGAALRLGTPLHTVRLADGRWHVDDTVRARVLVGAGGHFCPVVRLLGAALGAAEPIVAAQEAELELSASEQAACAVEPDVPEIFFTRDLGGYGWVVRKGSFVNLGLGRQDSRGLGEHVRRFVRFLEERGRIPRGLAARFGGHPYLLYGDSRRPLCGERALVVGDAAGLAYPNSGEGIRPAIESGLLAAQTIREANGDYTGDRLAAYERRVVARFGPRRAETGFSAALPPWLVQGIAGPVLGNAWFARHVVVDRWFLHAQQPALASA